ncbi:hypothetical protein ACT7C6_01495 [Bacillus paranthracis]
MHSIKTISIQATSLIDDFISSLSQEGDLPTKTLKEYTSDLKDFVFWFENVCGKHAEDTLFSSNRSYRSHYCSISRAYENYKIAKTSYD